MGVTIEIGKDWKGSKCTGKKIEIPVPPKNPF
jgi:hypothetical protein